MKIVIEAHQEVYEIELDKHQSTIYYRVRYKRRWWSPWRYLQKNFQHADPEVKNFSSKEEAVSAARSLRQEYDGPQHTVYLLDEYGDPSNKYSGG